MAGKDLILDCEFKVDESLLWKALTDKDLMKEWYIDVEEFKPIIGFTFEFWGGEEGDKKWKHHCKVLDVVPQRKLTYSWKYEGYAGMSYLTFEMLKSDKGTRLKLTHSGIDTFPQDVPELAFPNFVEGWETAINIGLKKFLEDT